MNHLPKCNRSIGAFFVQIELVIAIAAGAGIIVGAALVSLGVILGAALKR